MRTIELDFGQWLPDQADYKNPGVVVADNVYPGPGGFQPFETPVTTGSLLSGNVLGAKLFFRNNGTSLICGGTSTSLFTIVAGTVVETGSMTASAVWRFERFNDLIIAVAKENNPKYLDDLDTDTSWSDLGGSPPKAAVVGKVSDFLVLGNVDGGTNVPHRVQWSAFNNPTTTWGTDPGELSGFRDLDAKFGEVTGIVGGRWGLVFQQRAVWRMTFVGAPKVFEFELVADDRGCVAPDSIVTIGYQTYFLDQGGLFVTNGSEVAPLGDSRVNGWLDGEVDAARRDEVIGSVNWPKRCIVWAFKPPGASGYTRQIIYSFVTEDFSTATQTIQWLVQSNQDALTLGDLGALFPGGLGTMSAYEIGTSEWQAKDRVFGCFLQTTDTGLEDESGNALLDESGDQLLADSAGGTGVLLAKFTGTAAEAVITTGDYSIQAGTRALVDGVLPMVELSAGAMTVETRTRSTQGASYSVTSAKNPGVDGYAAMHVDGWFHSFRLKIAAGANWANAKGLWVRARGTGRR